MAELLRILAAAGIAMSVAACASDSPGDRAAGGAVIGGIGGAAVGAAVSNRHPGRGALIGGAVGAVGGAAVGAATAPPDGGRSCARVGYDEYGNRVCTAYY
ncbi:hypothetical protein J8I29_17975 [Labrys sp. LIt4]|uniref:YMGG-like Gly-zipper domain-containing protein n=1 Tax=Labrys okinawensis TaxID=346911 RepID=A0A2S9QIZ0_9HYPH|nr:MULTISPECIES: YMGG-like glycine zipper-containing protein [Labrys]MBP0581221.1 hypothetical protein [Labrys sp. LIt4]PRH89280.1 hypothetical protein C5L14_01410 [Labrys okinawensis]